MKRGGFLKRYTPLRQRTRLRAVNAERKAAMYERNFGSYADLIRMMPCVVCDRQPVEASHVKARGMGGCNSDKSSLVPMCTRCHQLYHVMGPRWFAARFEIDLEAEAASLWNEYGDGD